MADDGELGTVRVRANFGARSRGVAVSAASHLRPPSPAHGRMQISSNANYSRGETILARDKERTTLFRCEKRHERHDRHASDSALAAPRGSISANMSPESVTGGATRRHTPMIGCKEAARTRTRRHVGRQRRGPSCLMPVLNMQSRIGYTRCRGRPNARCAELRS